MSPIPVTVLAGYLGAGKTTLLNRILSEPHGGQYAVIVNEFGEIGIDAELVLDAQQELISLNNGCLCCEVRGDLLRTLKSLLSRHVRLDGIIIETSGLADPAPVAQTFFMDAQINAATRLDAIVTVADARHLTASLADSPEAAVQLAVADLVLINKIDLISAEQLVAADSAIRALNGFADIRHTVHASIDMAEILNRNAFDLQRVLERVPVFMATNGRHDNMVESASFRATRPLNLERFWRWIDSLLGDHILRVKGILHVEGENRRFVFQAVHRIMDGGFIDAWKPGERQSTLVIIGRHLNRERLQRNFEGCQRRQQ